LSDSLLSLDGLGHGMATGEWARKIRAGARLLLVSTYFTKHQEQGYEG